MNGSRAAPSPADVAQEGSTLLAGFGILTIQIFPFALPLLVLVIGPFAPLALIVPPLVAIVILPLWLIRTIVRLLTRRRGGAKAARPAAAAQRDRRVRQPTVRDERPAGWQVSFKVRMP
jgi:hypothetical protein